MIIYDINVILHLKKKNISLPKDIKKNIDFINNILENKITKKSKYDTFRNGKETYLATFKNQENNQFNSIEKKINIILNSLSKVNYNQVNKNLQDILESSSIKRVEYEKYNFNIIKENSIKISLLSNQYIKLVNNINFKNIIENEIKNSFKYILNKEVFDKNNNGFIIYIGELYNNKFLNIDQLQDIIDSLIEDIEKDFFSEKVITYLYELLKTIKDKNIITLFKNKYKNKIDQIYHNNEKISMKLKFRLLDINELDDNNLSHT